jgi:hypothetical protein
MRDSLAARHRLRVEQRRRIVEYADGPAESGAGRYPRQECGARYRRQGDLLRDSGQPNVGLRRFMSTTAAAMSWLGPRARLLPDGV